MSNKKDNWEAMLLRNNSIIIKAKFNDKSSSEHRTDAPSPPYKMCKKELCNGNDIVSDLIQGFIMTHPGASFD